MAVPAVSQAAQPGKLSSKVGVFYGYDSNANLSGTRKGDLFERIVFSANYIKPWAKDLRFTVDYDLAITNNQEITDLSHALNHFRLAGHKRLAPFTIGNGYDLGIFSYFDNEDGNLASHKSFLYLKHDITKRTFHKLEVESVMVDYFDKKALADSIASYQSKKRFDYRYGFEYSIGTRPTPRFFVLLKSKFLINNSNARYLNFYDYEAYKQSLSFQYKLLKPLYGFLRLGHTYKDYDSRTIANKDYKQKNNLYSGTLGVRYKLNDNDSLTLVYTHKENSSNYCLAEYTENVYTCGWQHKF